MHIMEGFLPIEWSIFWSVVALPSVIWGIIKIKRYVRTQPEKVMGLALAAAFILILSSLKLPSVVGSSSHPTGTGFSAIAYGPCITSVFSVIVLVFQAMLLAHGGFTTLGANIFSMGIAGPAVAYILFRILRKTTFSGSVFVAAVMSDLSTYLITSLQLASAFPGQNFLDTLIGFMAIFAITQVPLALIEGVIFVVFMRFLVSAKPELFSDILMIKKNHGGDKC